MIAAKAALVMAALNGARRGKTDHAALPITAAEIAAEAVKARAAGAALVHVHARDGDGRHTLDPARNAEVLAAVTAATGGDLVVQLTTEAVGRYLPDEMMAMVRAVQPEAVSMGIGELMPDPGAEAVAADFLAWAQRERIFCHYILYRAEEVDRFASLMAHGVIPQARPFVLFVLGRYAPGQTSVPEDLAPFLERLGDLDIAWSMCAFGAGENACARAALAAGGHVRVGFENNLLRPDGQPAADNAELVGLAADAVRETGRSLYTPAALRQALRDGRFH